ncbi:hypothetical protein LTR05_007424 [Lithohypha guttulata]|uniref:Uncharacterized protein n=1 Tax=Lithohypha guttulata TaxID=1690604 RepID=A0AAN7SV97_9EURO|nr:hypothetical protein LTR05_007424 [Lithohypha guttulata]
MAAGSLSEAFSFELKRKRHYEDDDLMIEHDLFVSKKPNLRQLPIRSPTRPSIAVTPAFEQFGSIPGTLTPDSIPEDYGYRSRDEQRHQFPTGRLQNFDKSALRITTNPDMSSLAVTAMDINSPKQTTHLPPTPIRIGRARSNDLMSPMRSPATGTQFASPTTSNFARDRLPTPVASSFPGRSPFESSFASAAARQLRPHVLQHSTILSPMMDAESWTPPVQRPPSPAPELDEPFDEDSAMAGVDDSQMSSSFTNLSVHSQDNLNDLPTIDSSPGKNWSPHSSNVSPRTRGLGFDGSISNYNAFIRSDSFRMSTITDLQRPVSTGGMGHYNENQQSNGRTAKLHMGFKSDCDKCIARVPGHYSHIMWS